MSGAAGGRRRALFPPGMGKAVMRLNRLITLLPALGLLVLLGAVGFYAGQFADGGLSIDQAAWGQFGDFVGGTVNPILGFLTLVAVVATVMMQFMQLALSRAALDATRAELAETLSAQQASARALAEQAAHARMSAWFAGLGAALPVVRSEVDHAHAEVVALERDLHGGLIQGKSEALEMWKSQRSQMSGREVLIRTSLYRLIDELIESARTESNSKSESDATP